MYTTNGKFIRTNPNKPDTDGDGLLDGEEIEMVFRNGRTVFIMNSDPNNNESTIEGTRQYYTNKFMTNRSGVINYNWGEIKKCLSKKAGGMSEAEYSALISVIDSMSAVDSGGKIIIDCDNFAKFLSCGYKLLTPPDDFPVYMEKYVPTDVIKNLSIIYDDYVEMLLESNAYTLFYENNSGVAKQQLNVNICKAGLLSSIAFGTESVDMNVLYSEIDKDHFSKNKEFELIIKRDVSNKYYLSDQDINKTIGYSITARNARLLDASGKYLNDSQNIKDITSSEFIADSKFAFHSEQRKLISSFYRNYTEEFSSKLKKTNIRKIIKKAVPYSSIVFSVTDELTKVYQVNLNNKKVTDILNEITEEDVFAAMQAGCPVTTIGESTIKKFIVFNPTEFQITLNAYNNYITENDSKFSHESKEKIEKEFQNMLDTGEISDILNSYRSWYSVNKDYYNGYRRDIQILLSDYRDNGHSDFEIKAVEDLTPEQINKLDEVYRGEKTIEKIKL